MSATTEPKAAALVPPRTTPTAAPRRPLTAPEFHQLAQVPPATECFANLYNPNTRRAYRNDLTEFMTFVGISSPAELRLVTRAHVLAWRRDLERRELTGTTIRRKLAALSSLFEYLSEANAVTHNPVKGVRRPKVESYEGKMPALGDAQARHLLKLPAGEGLKPKRNLSAIAPSCRSCSTTACGARSSRGSPCRIFTPGGACRTCACMAKAARCVISRSIRAPTSC